MADLEFTIKRHDLDPVIRVTIQKSDGQPFDFTGYTSPRFHMRLPGETTLKIDAAAVIETPETDGVLRYDWVGTDTDTAGTYDAEFELVSDGGRKQSFPTSGFIKVRVREDLNDT